MITTEATELSTTASHLAPVTGTCDRCGEAAAAAVSVLTAAGPLTFCGHHARQFASALAEYPICTAGPEGHARRP